MKFWRETLYIKKISPLRDIASVIGVWGVGLALLVVLLPSVLCGVSARLEWWWNGRWIAKCGGLLILLWWILRKVSLGCTERSDSDGLGDDDSDVPISRKEEDALSRGPFVAMLFELLRSFPEKDFARYVGLYAPWGDGKTSVINLLKERFRDCPDGHHFAFVEFQPWKYQTQSDLPFLFFSQLSEQLMRSDGRVGREFKELAKAVRLRYIGSRIGIVEEWLHAVGSLFTECVLSESAIRKKLAMMLVESRQKIVVVIDDLDRLPKDEVCQVIRFLKAHGDMPNVIYIIAADETNLARAVGDGLVAGDENVLTRGRYYLEKIIPISRQLPPVNSQRMLEFLSNFLDDLLTTMFPEGIDKRNLDLSIAEPYLCNVRQLKRLVNALRIDIAFAKKRVGDRVYLGVDIGDYVALSVLREFERDFYQQLPKVHDRMLSAMGWPYESKGVTEDWMEKSFWGLSTLRGREVVKDFVLRRLGIKVNSVHGKAKIYTINYTDDSDELIHYRLSSRLCFPGYFLSEVEDVQLYQGTVVDFLAAIAKKEFPTKLLLELDENGKIPFLMYILESQNVFEDEEESLFYMRALIRLGEMNLKPVAMNIDVGEITWRELTVYERIFRCLRVYCQKFKMELLARSARSLCKDGEDHVGFLLLPILEDEGSLIMLERFIAQEGDRHKEARGGDISDCYFTDAEFARMEQMFVHRIARRQQDCVSVNLSPFLNMFRSWLIILDKANDAKLIKEFSLANDRWLSDYTTLRIMLIFFADDERAARNVSYAVAVDMDRLSKYWTSDQIEQIAQTLETTQKKDERDVLFLAALKFALSEKARGAVCGKEAQFEYLKDHYRQLVLRGKAGDSDS